MFSPQVILSLSICRFQFFSSIFTPSAAQVVKCNPAPNSGINSNIFPPHGLKSPKMPRGQNGTVEIDLAKLVVTKRPRIESTDNSYGNRRRLFSLSRELLCQNYLGDGKHVPKLIEYFAKRAVVCGNAVNLVTEIKMEYCGPSLWTCRQEGYLISPSKLLKEVLEACAYLNSKGVIHFDVKSDNITFCMETGRAKLIDFGLSELTAEDVTRDFRVQPLEKTVPDSIKRDEDMGRVRGSGTLFYQNSFRHEVGGKAKVSVEVNHPLFRDPTLLCADYLQVAKGLANDSRADVYGAAASVLFYMGWMQDWHEVTSAEGCLKLLDNIRSVVGSINNVEKWRFRDRLLEAAKDSGKTSSMDLGLFLAMQSKLSEPPNYEGMLDSSGFMAEVHGKNFTSCLKRAMHPVNVCRPCASQCLEASVDEELPAMYPGQTDLAIFHSPSSCLVGQVRVKSLCIVSVCISPGNKLIWCTGLRGVDQGTKTELLRLLHAKSCACRLNSHAKIWFLALDRRSRMGRGVFREYPMI